MPFVWFSFISVYSVTAPKPQIMTENTQEPANTLLTARDLLYAWSVDQLHGLVDLQEGVVT